MDDAPRRPGPVSRVRALRYGADGGPPVEHEEQLATEEPLEIRIGDSRRAVTMRTPGADFELAAGWLLAEGVISGPDDLVAVRYCTDVVLEADERFNVVTVDLAKGAAFTGPPPRSFVVSSACGVCGRETLDDLRERGYRPAVPGPPMDPAVLAGLPDRLREHQAVFTRTGGLHAAGLVDLSEGPPGAVLVVREDVGRHNAVDKVIGWALLGRRGSLAGTALVVSGRASFELCQKAVAAGIPALVSVSAPSSMAVSVARSFGLTLAAFAREGRVTVYSGEERLAAR